MQHATRPNIPLLYDIYLRIIRHGRVLDYAIYTQTNKIDELSTGAHLPRGWPAPLLCLLLFLRALEECIDRPRRVVWQEEAPQSPGERTVRGFGWLEAAARVIITHCWLLGLRKYWYSSTVFPGKRGDF